MHKKELVEEIGWIYKRIYAATDINTLIVGLTCPSLKLTFSFSFSFRNFELERVEKHRINFLLQFQNNLAYHLNLQWSFEPKNFEFKETNMEDWKMFDWDGLNLDL